MNMTAARKADPRELEKGEEHALEAPPPALDLSLEQLEGRALARTEVLTRILEREEVSYVRHWGLNE